MKRKCALLLIVAALLVSTPQVSAETSFSAALAPAEQSAGIGDTVYVRVSLSGPSYWNAADLTLEYDTERLDFDKDSSVFSGAQSVSESDGVIRLKVYGEKKNTSGVYSLAFTVEASGKAAVILKKAGFDTMDNSWRRNLPDAAITNRTAVINCKEKGYSVELPDWFEGNAVARENEDYTFTARDSNYSYSFSGTTVNGASAAVTASEDGTMFTISKITGPVVIQSQRTPKIRKVSISGSARPDITGNNTAVYMTDYCFTLDKKSGYTYSAPEIYIAGERFTGYTASGATGTYTIPGMALTGDVIIRISKDAIGDSTEESSKTASVTVSGTGAGDVTGSSSIVIGSSYTFTVDKKDGYTYDVTVTMAGNTVTPEISDNQYTISKVTGNIAVHVAKTAQTSVSVYNYLKLDRARSIYLVVVTGPLEDNQTYTYEETPMFYSVKYGGSAYLVISSQSLSDFKSGVTAKISMASAVAARLVYSGDINRSETADMNDVQTVWNMYNARYDSFSQMSVETFLRADANGDHVLNTEDAAAVLSMIP